MMGEKDATDLGIEPTTTDVAEEPEMIVQIKPIN